MFWNKKKDKKSKINRDVTLDLNLIRETETENITNRNSYPSHIRFDLEDFSGMKVLPSYLIEIFYKLGLDEVPIFTHRDILVSDSTTSISVRIVCEDEIHLANAISKLTCATLALAEPSMDGKNIDEAKKQIKEVQKLLIKIQNNIENEKVWDNSKNVRLETKEDSKKDK
jgi:hypothetical protein